MSSSSGRLSTTARMSMPTRVRLIMSASSTATPTAQPIEIIWWTVTAVSKIVTFSGPKNTGNGRASVGFQIHSAAPTRLDRSPTETTTRVVSDAVESPRMMTSSTRAPNSGANTPSTRTRATGAGQFQPNRICQ